MIDHSYDEANLYRRNTGMKRWIHANYDVSYAMMHNARRIVNFILNEMSNNYLNDILLLLGPNISDKRFSRAFKDKLIDLMLSEKQGYLDNKIEKICSNRYNDEKKKQQLSNIVRNIIYGRDYKNMATKSTTDEYNEYLAYYTGLNEVVKRRIRFECYHSDTSTSSVAKEAVEYWNRSHINSVDLDKALKYASDCRND